MISFCSKENKSNNVIAMVYWIIIIALALILINKASFSIVDDHHFLDSLLSGSKLNFHIVPETGRFYPLNGQEYNLVSLLSIDPMWFYVFNGLELILEAWLLIKIGKLAAGSKQNLLCYGIALIIIFSPGFMTAWTRLQVPERDVLLLFSIFLYNYLKFKKNPNNINLIVAVSAATISLFYKETSFIFIGSIGALGLMFDAKNKKDSNLYLALCSISLIWLSIYIAFYFSSQPIIRYGETKISYFLSIPFSLAFFTLSDPLIIFSILLLIIYKFINIRKYSDNNYIIENIFLISGFTFILSYFALKIYAYHYLLPISCILPYIIIKGINNLNFEGIKNKLTYLTLILIYLGFTFPVSLNILYSNKAIPFNFKILRAEMVKAINGCDGKCQVILAGLNQNASIEIIYSIRKFLEYDLEYYLDIKSEVNESAVDNCKYYADMILKNCPVQKNHLKTGDIILLTPYDSIDVRSYIESSGEYSLLYKTEAVKFLLPNFKSALKDLIIQLEPIIGKYRVNATLKDQVNFYIYIKN